MTLPSYNTIVGMAKHMNMQVIAEGVETEGQVMHLMSAGCERVQVLLREADAPEAFSELINKRTDTIG